MFEYKVLVTGNDSESKSGVVIEKNIKVDNYFIYQPGFSVEIFWRTPTNANVGATFKNDLWNESSILPDKYGTTGMIVTFPPTKNSDNLTPIDLDNISKEIIERLPGLAETFEAEPPGYHITNTIDYVMLLEGEVTLMLDDQKSHKLKPGNVVVQNGTRHAWINESSNNARLLVIMVGVNRV